MGQQQQQQAPPLPPLASSGGGSVAVVEGRRGTRSTLEIPPEWIKVPVSVPYAADPRVMVDGLVFYSFETQSK